MEERVIVKKPPKSPGLAGILAFFFPFGVGQLYNEQYRKALVFFLVFAGLVTLQTTGEGQPFMGLMLGGFYFYQLMEAIQTAKRINRISLNQPEERIEVEEFPDVLKSGSIFWGGFLIALGGLLLLANFEIIDYGTLWDFWPVAVIVIGVKLIADYYAKNGEES
jgi:TM2 domain-containing membrane protein YozV